MFTNPISMLMEIMRPSSQSHFHLSFIFIQIKFNSFLFLCDVCNESHEHMNDQLNYDDTIIH